jgi:hypothetical protein
MNHNLANTVLRFQTPRYRISLTKPDGTSMTLNATTDKNGFFSASYVPTEVGEWGWVAYYEGKRTIGYTYNEAYSNWNTISVVAAPTAAVHLQKRPLQRSLLQLHLKLPKLQLQQLNQPQNRQPLLTADCQWNTSMP